MHPRFVTPIVFLIALASAVSASAQGTAPRPAPLDRPWYVAMTGGAVSQAPGQPALGVEVGQRIGRHGQGYFGVSYLDNLMRQSLTDDLDATASRLATLTGDSWAFTGKDRGVSVIGGGKYLFGGGTIRPYVGGGAGLINLKRTVTDVRMGDVTRAVFNDFDLGDAELSLATESVIKPLVEGAFGVEMGSGRVHFDVGLRYRQAFGLAEALNFTQIGVGFGYRW
jgi:hypothetical protein